MFSPKAENIEDPSPLITQQIKQMQIGLKDREPTQQPNSTNNSESIEYSSFPQSYRTLKVQYLIMRYEVLMKCKGVLG